MKTYYLLVSLALSNCIFAAENQAPTLRQRGTHLGKAVLHAAAGSVVIIGGTKTAFDTAVPFSMFMAALAMEDSNANQNTVGNMMVGCIGCLTVCGCCISTYLASPQLYKAKEHYAQACKTKKD